MRIGDLSSVLNYKVNNFTYNDLTRLSNGRDISELMKQCVELNEKTRDKTENGFVDYFRKSLPKGACRGQVLSCIELGGDKKAVCTKEHIRDAICYQVVHEVRTDLEAHIERLESKSAEPVSPRKVKYSKLSGKKIIGSKVSVKNAKIEKQKQLCLKLWEIEKIAFTNLKVQNAFVVRDQNSVSESEQSIGLDEDDTSETAFHTIEQVESGLRCADNVSVVAHLCPVDEDEDRHEFCIIKKDARYIFYDTNNDLMIQSTKKIDHIFEKIVQSVGNYSPKLKYVKFTFYEAL